MGTVETTNENDLGYRFLCVYDGEVGDEVLVFQRGQSKPYGLGKADRKTSQGFEVVIIGILE